MDIRFALTRQALAAAERDDESVVLFLDGVPMWERSFDGLRPYLAEDEAHVRGTSAKEGDSDMGVAGVITLALPLGAGELGGGGDTPRPYHVLEVAVGDAFTSRAEFRLELSPVEPFG